MTRSLEVAIDAEWWVHGPPSGRNVLRSLVSTWLDDHPHDRLVLQAPLHDAETVRDDLGGAVRVIPTPRYARVQSMAASALGRRVPTADAVVTQNFGTRSRGAVSCVLVHDAMFADHPEWFSLPERAYLSLLRPSLRAADVIFTTSATETDRVARVWPEVADRVRSIGLAVPSDLAAAAPRRPAGLRDGGPFVLAVGRLNVRKNLGALLDGVARLGDTRLVVVGEGDGVRERLPDAVDLELLGRVDDHELAWLYEHCAVFAFPSLDEGFGLPLVEAAERGARIVASDIPVFREIGLADELFDPRSPASIGDAIGRALQQPPAPRRSGPWTWSNVVESMRSAIVERRRNHEQAA